ncbi:MAG: ribosome assembly RNA-binding protein YhbY [Myxococcota bacterium]|nr:ribosome assembly RNA-binding protein YhbY [Myxococcota bacterium]
MTLTGKQNRHLRSLAHHRKPAVLIGANRVTEGVIKRVDEELEHHELIKVKLLDAEREEVREAEEILVARTNAVRVQIIGHTLVLYRRREKDPEINLPKR